MKTIEILEARIKRMPTEQLANIFNFLKDKNGATYLHGMDIQYIFNAVFEEMQYRSEGY